MSLDNLQRHESLQRAELLATLAAWLRRRRAPRWRGTASDLRDELLGEAGGSDAVPSPHSMAEALGGLAPEGLAAMGAEGYASAADWARSKASGRATSWGYRTPRRTTPTRSSPSRTSAGVGSSRGTSAWSSWSVGAGDEGRTSRVWRGPIRSGPTARQCSSRSPTRWRRCDLPHEKWTRS